MRHLRTAFLLAACLALGACVVSPLSRTGAESDKPVTLQGYALSNTQTITIKAVNQNTGAIDTLGHAVYSGPAVVHTTSAGTTYTLYPWIYKAGVLPANYWSPQDIVADLATAQGHLELFASDGGSNFSTFSPGAADAAMAAGADLGISSAGYHDGDSTVLFDQTGVGSGPAGSWVNVRGMTSSSASYPPVAWSVGYYTVEGGKKIYGLICTPATGGPYPVIIYNHGGTGAADGGNVSGAVTAAGWTAQPANFPGQSFGPPDGLGQCIDWAKRGWVFATASYRGEAVNIASSDPDAFAAGSWQSDGAVEFCMGEVTDVMALTDLVMNHAGAIAVGSAGHTVSPKVSSKLFMYGYSHGGCITWRAVEQGAPVTAFSVVEGFTDLRLTYLTVLANWPPPAPPPLPTPAVGAAIGSGAYQPGVSTYQPDAAGVMGYNWRSAHYFASRGDLAIRKFTAMPILILHGDVDKDATGLNPVPLSQPSLVANDIGATNIFVGPTGLAAPTSEPCVAGPAGAPLPAALTGPNASCAIGFVPKDTGDPCVADGLPFPTQCAAIALPLSSQPQQQHYFVVYHNMDHVNGGLAIKSTFGAFVEHNFSRQPGCDGLVINCASD